MSSPDNNLERRARALYREASRQIDPVTAGRLRAARRAALAVATPPAVTRMTRLLVPAGAFAAVAFAALMFFAPMRGDLPNRAQGTEQTEQDDLPPDVSSIDPSMVQNLDFYDWLATNDSTQASR
ncbi:MULTISPECIES: hypothetical protein [Dyella]|uniref:DUF3619 family protein n=2 Tax=Dyella TaxID=231454 RepID=A0A4R0YMX9_9GAMM|nr:MULTISPECIES: hypothetical protein [Dyella]TBR37244.1 hypothetical protein EYV96_15305 [Dyella terrae]TCI07666.1 hypothetical protein EZM97_23565 [Dyella soli]